MFKKRKSEEDIRYEKRVTKLLVDIQHAFDWLAEHQKGIVFIVVSKDDYGHNLQEDWSVSFRAQDIVSRVSANLDYHFWTFIETVDQFMSTKGYSRKRNVDMDIKCINVPIFSSNTKVGDVSKSKNHRTGEILALGIAWNRFMSELTSPPRFNSNQTDEGDCNES